MSDAKPSKRLRGMTWDHPRGYDPLIACSARWRELTGVDIQWDRRSLQDFESYPVEQLARRYDLIIVDHPHVGQVTTENCLIPLDSKGRETELAAIARGSVGPSFATYTWQGRQWAFPIDVAAQVQAWRPDLIQSSPENWVDVLAMARDGLVEIPLKPPHSLMCLYTLTAGLGQPCRTEKEKHIAEDTGAAAYETLVNLVQLIEPGCFQRDPIAILEAMSRSDSRLACAPLTYGYVSYAMQGFRSARIRFGDIPALEKEESRGSALGGTGIAVSAYSSLREEAVDFAYWVASGTVQRDLYAQSGGQPGHADAWSSEGVDAAAGGFYRKTRQTMERAYVRPRHNGYMPFQHWAAARLNQGLTRREPASAVIADLNRAFLASFQDQRKKGAISMRNLPGSDTSQSEDVRNTGPIPDRS